MLRSVYLKSVRDRWVAALLAVVALFAVAWMGIWSFAGMGADAVEFIEAMPPAYLSLTGISAEGGVVGTGGRGKIDGLPKITGRAQFTGDMVLPRMAHAKVLRSPHAHARILSIDASDALEMPGVLGVLTGEDVPIRYGAIPVAQDETALAIDKVRYIGEPVAAV